MQLAVSMYRGILEIFAHPSQKNLSIIIRPSQYTGEKSQRVGFNRHEQGALVVPTNFLLHGIPSPNTRWNLENRTLVSHNGRDKQKPRPKSIRRLSEWRDRVAPCTPHLEHLQNQPQPVAAGDLRRYS